MSEITQWLNDSSNSPDSGLAAGLYAELQRIARARMAGERPEHTLEPTALVHEAWLRLEKSAPAQWRDRRQFFAAAAEVMRRILVESARRRLAHKRGGGGAPVPLDEFPVASPLPDERLLRVHEVLDQLALEDETKGLLGDAARADSFFGDGDGATLGAEDFKKTYAEKEGDVIGPYTLRQQIGDGGFGVVWMAEQSVPISRMVALKVIKAGMDTKQVLARFEAERQALAMMDHPNIAKVLDAGATLTGRPWFAMELVKGIPITGFCDEKGLGTRERLALFRDVCAAINHAHQKGIIHRAIKPSTRKGFSAA